MLGLYWEILAVTGFIVVGIGLLYYLVHRELL